MSVEIVQFNNYVKPVLTENKSKNWVLNGQQNSFYQYVIDRYNGSVTNATIINAYTELIYGRGLFAKDSHFKITQWASLLSILKGSELKKIIADFVLFGEASLQVVKTKDKKEISGIYHIAKNHVVPSIENADGIIEGYWVSKDFKDTKIVPVYYPSFGTSSEAIEIYVIKPYRAGQKYFAYPDYFSGISYAELEEEITNFYLNSIRKGLSAGFIINIPNGVSKTDEDKEEIKNNIQRKITGSKNAMSFVLDFHGEESDKMGVTNFPTNENIHKQWSYLSAEARQQLMTAHKVTSPMLFGIKDNTGFGNNADELDTAEAQLMKRVVSPKQNIILDAIKEIISFNDIYLDLQFAPLTEVKSSGVQMSDDEKKKSDLDIFLLSAEDEDLENYDIISSEKYDDNSVEINFASVPDRLPIAPSIIDNDIFKVRFQYAGSLKPQRDFCKKMMALGGGVFRKEDIDLASTRAVNPGWGPNGTDTYDILKYKGGGGCHHFWQRKVYLKKGNKNITIENAQKMLRDLGIKTAIPTSGEPLSTVKPKDMPNRGFLKKK